MPQPRISIIDDDALIRSLLSAALADEGFRVTEAEDGHEGLTSYLADQPDILITDIQMPEMDGLELIRAIRKSNPDAKIIAISGKPKQQDLGFLGASLDFGATAVLEKPFDPDDLVHLVYDILSSGNSTPAQP